MMFQKKFIKELFELIEAKHSAVFWKVFLDEVHVDEESGASEYELYFNFMIAYHTDKVIIRPLQWKNSELFQTTDNLDFFSWPYYSRTGFASAIGQHTPPSDL